MTHVWTVIDCTPHADGGVTLVLRSASGGVTKTENYPAGAVLPLHTHREDNRP